MLIRVSPKVRKTVGSAAEARKSKLYGYLLITNPRFWELVRPRRAQRHGLVPCWTARHRAGLHATVPDYAPPRGIECVRRTH